MIIIILWVFEFCFPYLIRWYVLHKHALRKKMALTLYMGRALYRTSGQFFLQKSFMKILPKLQSLIVVLIVVFFSYSWFIMQLENLHKKSQHNIWILVHFKGFIPTIIKINSNSTNDPSFKTVFGALILTYFGSKNRLKYLFWTSYLNFTLSQRFVPSS